MDTIQFVALLSMFVFIGTSWVRSIPIKLAAFGLVTATGLLSDWVEPVFIASALLMLVVTLWARDSASYLARLLSYISLVLVALALGVHVFPGYNSMSLLENTQITDLTGWTELRFMIDKPLVGVIILSVLFRERLIHTFSELKRAIKNSLPFTIVGMVIVYAIGLGVGYVEYDWSPSIVLLLWLVRNLFFTVIAEEALFRGVIMDELARRWRFRRGKWLALLVSSILFGVAHIAGGIEYVFLASVSGMIYGYAMMRTGRIEMAILAHLLLNTGHILFLSY